MNTSPEHSIDESNKKRSRDQISSTSPGSPSSIEKPAKMPKDDDKILGVLTSMENRLSVDIGGLRKDINDAMEFMKKRGDEVDLALENLDRRMNDLEQENLNASIALVGLPPVNKGHDVFINISKFGEAIGEKIEVTDLKDYFAFNLKTGTGCQINMIFWQESKKRALMIKYTEKMKADKPILAHVVVPALVKESPYRLRKLKLYPQLTRFNQQLMKKAHEHHDRFKFIWFGRNKVMLRASENSPFLTVQSFEHLRQLVQEAPLIASDTE